MSSVPPPPGPYNPAGPNPQNPAAPNGQPPTAPYGQPAPPAPATPYGQPAAPAPTYGQPAAPAPTAPYGQPAAPTYGAQPTQAFPTPPQGYGAPGQPPQQAWGQPTPPAKQKTGLIVGLSVAGVVVIGGAVAAFLLLSGGGKAEPLGDVTEKTTAQAQQLGEGHCIANLPSDGEITEVTVVPCDETHNAQVVGVKKLANKETFPGEDKVTEQTVAMCTPDLVTNTDADPGDLQYVVWTPTEESWAQDDRSGLCIAWTEGELTESLLK